MGSLPGNLILVLLIINSSPGVIPVMSSFAIVNPGVGLEISQYAVGPAGMKFPNSSFIFGVIPITGLSLNDTFPSYGESSLGSS